MLSLTRTPVPRTGNCNVVTGGASTPHRDSPRQVAARFSAIPTRFILDRDIADDAPAIRLFTFMCTTANETGVYRGAMSDAADRLALPPKVLAQAIQRLRGAGWVEMIDRTRQGARFRLRPVKGLPDDERTAAA